LSLDFTPQFISTRDGTRLRTAVIGEDARGVCVLLHGQSEFIEKYCEVIAELNARGFTVATFDWRGQGGSARALSNPLKSYVRDFAQYDDDLTSFLDQVVKPLAAKPPLVLAHSMGGHVLLRNLHDKPGLCAAGVLSAPMLQISTRGYPPTLTRAITGAYNLFGKSGDFAWGMAERDPFLVTFDTQLVTSDRARFARVQEFLKAHPDLRLAGPTWGWLEAAYRSMARVTAPGFAEKIATPILICGAGHDRIVVTQATRDFAGRLPHGTYLDLAESEHEMLMENDSVRASFWQAFDEFAARNA
jgi:lysophospholipase